MVQAAIAAGLDAMVFTDHYSLADQARLRVLNERYAPFRIYGGIEITADGEDWLVLGLQNPELEREDWRYPALHRYVRSHGGYIILAHPFRYSPRINADIQKFKPDGIEVRSRNTPANREKEITTLAGTLGLRLFVNSDAHSVRAIGAYYNEIAVNLDGDRGLIDTLRLPVQPSQKD